MNKKQITTKTYNDHALDFYKKFEHIGPRLEAIDVTFSKIKKENPAVLELGCAYGRDAKEILKRTDNYVGIDIAEEFINLAQSANPTGSFETADLETYQFPKNLDIIFAFASLLHCEYEEFQKCFDKAHESLNENGLFYISTKPADHYKEEPKTDEYGTRYAYYYSLDDIKKMSQGKFKIIYQDLQNTKIGTLFMEILLQKI